MSIDPNSPTWAAVKRFAETEIEQARTALEAPSPEAASNLDRGRILALRAVLALADAQPDFKAGRAHY